MFPGIFEFRWDPDHLIFLGAFYLVLSCVGTFIVAAVLRAVRDLRARRVEAIRWQEEFHDLPPVSRRCRHELNGRVSERVCSNGFDCRSCTFHTGILAGLSPDGDGGKGTRSARRERSGTARAEAGAGPRGQAAMKADSAGSPEHDAREPAEAVTEVFGFVMPHGRLYHRGHTWVQPQDDGTLAVGLDDFGSRLVGDCDRVELPARGSHVRVNGTGWRLVKGGNEVRVLSPVEGTVVETGGWDRGWYVKVRPERERPDLRHLLEGIEIRPWLLMEVERLHGLLSSEALGASLADGGAPVQDFSKGYPDADWDAIWGEMFLEP